MTKPDQSQLQFVYLCPTRLPNPPLLEIHNEGESLSFAVMLYTFLKFMHQPTWPPLLLIFLATFFFY